MRFAPESVVVSMPVTSMHRLLLAMDDCLEVGNTVVAVLGSAKEELQQTATGNVADTKLLVVTQAYKFRSGSV